MKSEVLDRMYTLDRVVKIAKGFMEFQNHIVVLLPGASLTSASTKFGNLLMIKIIVIDAFCLTRKLELKDKTRRNKSPFSTLTLIPHTNPIQGQALVQN